MEFITLEDGGNYLYLLNGSWQQVGIVILNEDLLDVALARRRSLLSIPWELVLDANVV